MISVLSLVSVFSFLSLHNSLVPAQKTLLGVNLTITTIMIELGDCEKEHNTVDLAYHCLHLSFGPKSKKSSRIDDYEHDGS